MHAFATVCRRVYGCIFPFRSDVQYTIVVCTGSLTYRHQYAGYVWAFMLLKFRYPHTEKKMKNGNHNSQKTPRPSSVHLLKTFFKLVRLSNCSFRCSLGSTIVPQQNLTMATNKKFSQRIALHLLCKAHLHLRTKLPIPCISDGTPFNWWI